MNTIHLKTKLALLAVLGLSFVYAQVPAYMQSMQWRNPSSYQIFSRNYSTPPPASSSNNNSNYTPSQKESRDYRSNEPFDEAAWIAEENQRKEGKIQAEIFRHIQTGHSYYNKRDFYNAHAHYQKAVELGSGEALFLLGTHEYENNRFAEARKFYEKGQLAKYKSYPAWYFNALMQLQGQGGAADSVNAIKQFRLLIADVKTPKELKESAQFFLERISQGKNLQLKLLTKHDRVKPIDGFPNYLLVGNYYDFQNVVNSRGNYLLPEDGRSVEIVQTTGVLLVGKGNRYKKESLTVWKISEKGAELFVADPIEHIYRDKRFNVILLVGAGDDGSTFAVNSVGKIVYASKGWKGKFGTWDKKLQVLFHKADSAFITDNQFRVTMKPFAGKICLVDSSGLVVERNKKQGLIDWSGKTKIPFEYTIIDSLRRGVRVVGIDQNPEKKLTWLDYNYYWIRSTNISEMYLGTYAFGDTKMAWGLVNDEGRVLTKPWPGKIRLLAHGCIAKEGSKIVKTPTNSFPKEMYVIHDIFGKPLLDYGFELPLDESLIRNPWMTEVYVLDQKNGVWQFNLETRTLRKYESGK